MQGRRCSISITSCISRSFPILFLIFFILFFLIKSVQPVTLTRIGTLENDVKRPYVVRLSIACSLFCIEDTKVSNHHVLLEITCWSFISSGESRSGDFEQRNRHNCEV